MFQKAGLAVIVATYLTLAFLYAVSTPKWNAPDEPAHYNYLQELAEERQLPVLQVGDYDFTYLEELKATRFPDGKPIGRIRYEGHQPPLYYLLATPVYAATSGLSVDLRVVVLRLFTAIFGALLLLVAYAIAKELSPGEGWLALAVPGFIAFVPMYIATSAAISNDALAELMFSVLLLIMVRMLRRAPTRQQLVTLGAVLGLALLTKTTVYVAVGLVAPVLLWVEFRHQARESGLPTMGRGMARAAASLGLVYGIAAAISGWWFVRNAIVYGNLDLFGLARHDQVVVGQPLTGPLDAAAARHFLVVTFESFWAQFGWMGILVDDRIYLLLAGLSGVAALGLVFWAVRVVRQPRSLSNFQWWAMALLLVSLLLVLGGVVRYNLVYIQAQGRYLFPALVPIAIFFLLGWRELVAREHVGGLTALLLLGLMALDLLCLYQFIIPAFR